MSGNGQTAMQELVNRYNKVADEVIQAKIEALLL